MKSTLLKKLLIFTLPITMIPLVVVMIFYYIYVHKVLENDIIYYQQRILIHIVDDVKELIHNHSKLENHIKHEHIALPEITIFDKEMNMIANNFDIKNSDKAKQKYNKEVLKEHFNKVLQSQEDTTLHDKKNALLIKPMMHDGKIIAYVTSGYKSTVDAKMTAINQTFLYMFFVIIFTVFIISNFVIIFALKLLYPLELLLDGIKNINSGNLSFIIKKTTDDELGVVVNAVNDMTLKRKQIEDELRDMAIRDGLTGLYNHKFFYTFLENEIVRGDRYDHSISMLLIDIDHFKGVNDTYGHRAGDTILRELSKRLMKRARTTDTVCRYGGEEITVILLETDIAVAQIIAEELRLLIEKDSFLIEDGRYIPITVSIGISDYNKEAKKTSIIVSNADSALYEAKERGRNQICVFKENVEGRNEEGEK